MSFAQIPDWILSSPLTSNAKVVYGVLALRADVKTRTCWPSQTKLSEDSGLSLRRVQRALRELRMVHAIAIERRSSGRGRLSNQYVLVPGPLKIRRLTRAQQQELDGMPPPQPDTRGRLAKTDPTRHRRQLPPAHMADSNTRGSELDPPNLTQLQKPSASERSSKNARSEATSKNPGRTPDEPRAAAGPGKSRQVVRVPDPAFNALAEATGMNPAELTRGARRQVAVALASIRTAAADLNGQLPDEIRLRAQRYARAHPDWALTPFSLDKWWPTLGADGGSARTNRLARLVEAMDE